MADFLFTGFAQQNPCSGTNIVLTNGRETPGIAPARYVSDAIGTAALFAAHPRIAGRSSNGRYWRAVPELGRIAVEVGKAKGDGLAERVRLERIGGRGMASGTIAAQYRDGLIPSRDDRDLVL